MERLKHKLHLQIENYDAKKRIELEIQNEVTMQHDDTNYYNLFITKYIRLVGHYCVL